MTLDELSKNLTQEFSQEISEISGDSAEKSLSTSKEALPKIAQYLKEKGYNYLSFITAVDNPKNFTVLYCFKSLSNPGSLTIKVDIPKTKPNINSLVSLFAGANWLEREVYDLMGIKFNGHTDLRRILLPEDWEGHPLRKSYFHPEIEKRPQVF